ncbi:MAG TPA: outer membrane protein assembly factor BamD [Steroidobacteraceae bacterium]|jgi:outer membrane protein assembly factor BamD
MGAVFLAALTLLSGCHLQAKKLRNANAETLYANAHKALNNNDFEYAIKQYEALTARFPFTNQARQARLDLIYAYYRKGEKETAIDAADQFLRENPTHPRVDYAWYMKGMIYFERTPWAVERFFGVDMAKRPPTDLQKSITAFSTVVTQYPQSEYAPDALRRMTYLRNRLAEYEINVARYYVRRGAYIAAARRAEGVVEQYDGAPSEREALAIMLECYRRLGYTELAANVERVYQTNYPAGSEKTPGKGKHWWQVWRH